MDKSKHGLKNFGLWLSMLPFLFVILGCGGNYFEQTDTPKRETAPPPFYSAATAVFSPSAEGTPYPMADSNHESFSSQTTRPYPDREGSASDGLLPQPRDQTPTPHVDIILRATNPDFFVLASGKYQLVEFFAFWCPTCKSMAPVLRNLEHKYSEKVRFIYLDIDDPKTNPIKQALGYQYQPHIFLLDGEGKIMLQWVGYVAEEELDAILSSLQ